MVEPTRSLKHLLRRYAAAVRALTLQRGLASLSGAFERWKRGQIDSRELREKISEFEKTGGSIGEPLPHTAPPHPAHGTGPRRDASRGKKHGRA